MERWQQVEEIFHQALQRDPALREAYLRQACGSDRGLCGEVADLLTHHEQGSRFGPWASAAAAELIGSPVSLPPGQFLGPYRIEAFVAAGGMGHVYRATDTRLQREVAIKVCAERFSERFEREARVIASLNHPHICQLYDVGPNYLVMELVKGPTLADRIRQGALPTDEALAIARQIAEALEGAHEKDRVHRDLKPANIKITPAGVVKVLDFGLAKTCEQAPAAVDLSNSPTKTLSPTQSGIILGTAAYMSPEQARGQAVDKRTDIWAFGCVVFEMITGKPAFKGDTTSDILAAVIKEEPDLRRIPEYLRPTIAKCLRKDPRTRWRDIGDVRLALEEGMPAATAPVYRPSLLPWALVGVFAVALPFAGLALWRLTKPVRYSLMHLSVDLAPVIDPNGGANVIVSPDGTRVVFPLNGADGKRRLATRLLSQPQSTALPGTEDVRAEPFFSPDGEWIGFFAGGKLKKIPLQGGAPVIICDVRNPRGGSWGDDENIVFAPGNRSGLLRVSSNGGIPQPLTVLKPGELTHRWPQVLPGARSIIFTANTGTNWENGSIEIQSLTTGQRKTLHHGGSYGRYVPTGHLLYVHQSTLFATPFNPEREELTGLPTPILEEVTNSAITGGAEFDCSIGPAGHGLLAYVAGREGRTSIYSLDSAGNRQAMRAIPEAYRSPRFSPGGKRLAVALFSGNTGLWVLDLERDNFIRLTSTPGDNYPVWSPDGRHIAYESALTGIFWVRSDGSSPPERLMRSEQGGVPFSFSPDGKRLAYARMNPETGADIWTLPIEGSGSDHPKVGEPEPFLRTAANEWSAAFSPDGRWMAYSSDESGNFEVYVRPFPGPGSKWRVSVAGGTMPVWSKSGRELAYETLDRRLMIVSYGVSGDTFTPGKPRLGSTQQISPLGRQNMDLAPDGKHFAVLIAQPALPEESLSGGVSVLLNFFDYLKEHVPARK